jgi:restriction system protein
MRRVPRSDRKDIAMGRRSFLSGSIRLVRELERQAAAHQRGIARQEKALENEQRQRERQYRASQKDAARLHAESQADEAARLTIEIEKTVAELEGLLPTALGRNPRVDLDALRRTGEPLGVWLSHQPQEPAPRLEQFLPPKPSILARILPGSSRRYKTRVSVGHDQFITAIASYNEGQAEREATYEQHQNEIKSHNRAIDGIIRGLKIEDASSVTEYFTLAIEAAPLPDGFPNRSGVGFLPESKHLVVEYPLPKIDVVPQYIGYKYNRQQDRVVAVARPENRRKLIYNNLLAQLALRVLSDLFRAGYDHLVDCVTLNGVLEANDPATGNRIRPCLFSVRATRDAFNAMNLKKVDPLSCLKALRASVSPSPDELVPVKPILELSMVDRRFVDGEDVLSTLDQRPNLMNLSPGEFEALITNLFAKMGLETRLTQASRDGGVDCVAFDQRPILGGKVVIQAKRYKNTVGVSAIRDLFGTLQNEGASKGILVTTSGFGKAAFDFAAGKPMELLDGSNLLYLLAEHAGIEAKIVMPDD